MEQKGLSKGGAAVEDEKIIELYWNRDEQAIRASMDAYGGYCHVVAGGILSDASDVEEAVADTWLRAWNAIPPQRPKYLRLFLGKITRNISLSIWRKHHADSRGGGQVALALEELAECVSTGEDPEAIVTTRELEKAITAFLRTEPEKNRAIFLRRYFYLEDSKIIAERYGMQAATVRMLLMRMRRRLKDYLTKEGYIL